MKKIVLFIEEYNEKKELVFATMFVGVMDSTDIVAKRNGRVF